MSALAAAEDAAALAEKISRVSDATRRGASASILPNLNEATEAAVRRCPNFGPKTAHRLVVLRARGGPFKDWDNLISRARGVVGKRLLPSLKERFSVFQLRNVNTSNEVELEEAMREAERARETVRKNLKNVEEWMKIISCAVCRDRDFYGEFEDWEAVEERVGIGAGRKPYTLADAVRDLKSRGVRCEYAAEEAARKERESSYLASIHATSFTKFVFNHQRSQLESKDFGKKRLRTLAEYYGLEYGTEQSNKDLVDLIHANSRLKGGRPVQNLTNLSQVFSVLLQGFRFGIHFHSCDNKIAPRSHSLAHTLPEDLMI